MEEKKSFKEFLCSGVGKAGLIVVLYAIIFGLVMLTVEIFSGFEYIGLIYGLVFGVFGWKALNKIQPNIFLIMPIVGWVIFFVVKGALSVVVGIFVAPFVIAKKVTESIQNNL